jgi:phage gpG-like protein
MLGMKLVGDKEALVWARGAPAALKRAIEAGLRKGAGIVARTAKRLVYHGHPEHLEGDTGHLHQSITYQVHGAQYAEIGTNVRYAKIQEFGGTIVARDKLLTVPLGDRARNYAAARAQTDLKWAPGGGEGGRLLNAAGETVFLLEREVTIPARPTFGPAIKQSRDEVRDGFLGAVRKAMGKAAT